jgi:hypothetical protein
MLPLFPSAYVAEHQNITAKSRPPGSTMPDPPDKRGIDAEDAVIAQRPAKRVQYVTLRRSPWVLLIARTNGVVGSAEEFGARITFNEINIIVGPVHPSFPDLANFGMHYMTFCKKSRR